jgi:pimeloyl-ACP methyl ester carboxylesterase
MNIRIFLVTLGTLLVFCNVSTAQDSTPKTFVIVHGATGGGWDWKTVANLLQDQGHLVYRPTLSGLGARNHLAKLDINLTTHINDVVNLIEFEQLNDVVLVGHSYGGMVITGVMNQIPERLSHATFLDAGVPKDGANAINTWGTVFADLNIIDGLVYFPWLDADADADVPKDVPHPYKTLTEPVSFNNPQAQKINTSYVAFVPEGMSKTERAKDPSWARAEKRGWTMRTFAGDHTVYRVKPVEFVEMLMLTTKDQNQLVD